MRYKTSSAIVVVWALLAAPPMLQAFQHQHGGVPRATQPDPPTERETAPLELKDVLKAADRSLAALEKAVRDRRGPGAAGEQAARDYVSLVGWVERLFVDAEERGIVDPRDAERAAKALARQSRRLDLLERVESESESARLVSQAQEAVSAAQAALDSAAAVATPHHGPRHHERRRGGCGRP